MGTLGTARVALRDIRSHQHPPEPGTAPPPTPGSAPSTGGPRGSQGGPIPLSGPPLRGIPVNRGGPSPGGPTRGGSPSPGLPERGSQSRPALLILRVPMWRGGAVPPHSFPQARRRLPPRRGRARPPRGRLPAPLQPGAVPEEPRARPRPRTNVAVQAPPPGPARSARLLRDKMAAAAAATRRPLPARARPRPPRSLIGGRRPVPRSYWLSPPATARPLPPRLTRREDWAGAPRLATPLFLPQGPGWGRPRPLRYLVTRRGARRPDGGREGTRGWKGRRAGVLQGDMGAIGTLGGLQRPQRGFWGHSGRSEARRSA